MSRFPADGALNHIILLPGMDGTGKLFSQFVLQKPSGFDASVISLPQVPITYSEMESLITPHVCETRPYVLLGESFSGPLAILLASHRPPNLRGLILCNSFVSPPRPGYWRMLPWATLFAIPPPKMILRWVLMERKASLDLITETRHALAGVSRHVLASRIRVLLTSDLSEALRRCDVPTLYLRGTDDRLVPDSAFDSIAAIMPAAKRCNISGPHMLIQSKPKEVWKAIAEFIGSLSAEGKESLVGRKD